MSEIKLVAPAGAEAISVGNKVFEVVDGFILATVEEAKHLLAHAGCLTEEAAAKLKGDAAELEAKIEEKVEAVIKKRGKGAEKA